MGVSTQVNRQVYAGDGSSTAFAFPYYFFAQTDLLVYTYDIIAGVILAKVLNTDFTISGAVNAQGIYANGGTVNFMVAPSATTFVVIVRSPFQHQNYALAQNGQISSVALVQQFDYLTLLMQRLQDELSRCVQLPDGLGKDFNTVLPNTLALLDSAGAYLQINQNANGITLTPNQPQVTSKQVLYTDVQTAGMSFNLPIVTIPAGAMLTMLAIKHSQTFSGGAIASVLAQLGITSDYGRFIPGFDIFQAPADNRFDNIMTNTIFSFANPTQIYLTALSTGANLSALTQGTLTVYSSWVFL